MFITKWHNSVATSHCRSLDRKYSEPHLAGNSISPETQITADSVQFAFSVFEGMRVFFQNGKFMVFRAIDHYERLLSSCNGIGLPCPSYEVFLTSIIQVVAANYAEGMSTMYIRPIVYSSAGGIMPMDACAYSFSVASAEYDPLVTGVTLVIEENDLRTTPSFSSIKTASNYCSSFMALCKARARGYDNILWSDQNGCIQECTTMNAFFQVDDEIITPPLGAILPGVTRKTVIELMAIRGVTVVERNIHVDELSEMLRGRRVSRGITTSTALGINPIHSISYRGTQYNLSSINLGIFHQVVEEYLALTRRFEDDRQEVALCNRNSEIGDLFTDDKSRFIRM